MANVLGQFSYRIKDAAGVITNAETYAVFSDALTFANIQAYSDAYAAVLDPVTEGQIIQATFRVILTTTGLKSAPIADSDVQETLLVSLVQSGSFYKWGQDIPAEIDAIIVNGRVDLSNADLLNYTNFLTAAHSGFTPAGRMGNALLAVFSGVETFRKKRKQLNARSKTIK